MGTVYTRPQAYEVQEMPTLHASDWSAGMVQSGYRNEAITRR